ncbi:hypothetical protein DPMN_070668 [Dreissena polymorpha]|uniref:Uncharacterized protein n=1 Tax=Dreissena polymorpha TaxID=45954 RepID=A0A9D4BVU3_DREPO|nr:hypothetical protein DPMN_070668 [Dreissena polymorpha]
MCSCVYTDPVCISGILSECVELGYAEEASLQSPARDLAASILQSVVLGILGCLW